MYMFANKHMFVSLHTTIIKEFPYLLSYFLTWLMQANKSSTSFTHCKCVLQKVNNVTVRIYRPT